jgi:alpha-N-arabinofuranosidase
MLNSIPSRALLLTFCLLLVSVGTACSSGNEPALPDEDPEPDPNVSTTLPQFEWFEYEGRDPIYEERTAGPGEYQNPIIAGFHPDPSIARAGDDYYVVNSSFAYFPGLPIFHSTDLVNWEQVGHVVDRPSQLDYSGLGISRGIFAPTIRYHDGTFYVITTMVDGAGNVIMTASDPSGPWSDPIPLSIGGIDPSMFFDDDGTVYVTHNAGPPGEPQYDGHRALWIQEYDPEAQEMVGPHEVLVNGGVDISEEPIWIEAPHIFKVDGTYYLIAAEGGTGPNHSEVVFRSDSVRGPYEPYNGNPILTQRHLDPNRPNPVETAGHADFVKTPNGEWWSVFLATRNYDNGLFNTGRETFMLPVDWTDDGWPVILERDKTVPFVHEAPDLPQSVPSSPPTSGNFTVRADFEADSLAPYWNFIRAPQEPWHELEDGALAIEPRSASIGSLEQPSFVGRRQQHTHATASTALQFTPGTGGQKAGLAAFQNREYYYLLSVTREDGQPVVHLEKAAGGDASVIASSPVELSGDDPIRLRIEADAGEYDFSYAPPSGDWTILQENADGTILSTQEAGGFVGAYFGMYAFAPDS